MSEHHRGDSMDNYNYCLKTDNGKIVTVNEQIALCAVDIQNAKKNGTTDTSRNNTVNNDIFIDISPNTINLFYKYKKSSVHPDCAIIRI